MGTNVHLTPELERFAREVVAEGRYNNVSEVVRQGLRMLQEAEERKQRFMAMLKVVEARTEREGSISAEDALAEMDRVIEELERADNAKSARRTKAWPVDPACRPPRKPTWLKRSAGFGRTVRGRRGAFARPSRPL